MVVRDIGYILFREFLGMSSYPGAPFTGNIVKDLVLYLLVPSVFIFLVIHVMVRRFTGNNRIGLLVGITSYLFIIVSGYYEIFAKIAGPYFLVLIFFIGLLLFIPGHFRLDRNRNAGGGMPRQAFERTSGYRFRPGLITGDWRVMKKEEEVLKREIRDLERLIKDTERAEKDASKDPDKRGAAMYHQQRLELGANLREKKMQLENLREEMKSRTGRTL
jgi:hypothetical protein